MKNVSDATCEVSMKMNVFQVWGQRVVKRKNEIAQVYEQNELKPKEDYAIEL